jgi:hypothetical protein
MFVRTYRPGAQVIDYRLRPDLAEPIEQPAKTPGMDGEIVREIGEILIGYHYQGQDYREVIRTTVTVQITTMNVAGMASRFLAGFADPALAMRAPDGQLDFRLFDFVVKSIKLDPQWLQRVTQVNAAIGQAEAKGVRDRFAITTEANDYVSDLIVSGYEGRQRVLDSSNANWSRMTRGVEIPNRGEQVELPNTYSNAWRLNDGSYVIAEDPSFDPNVTLGVDAYRLTPAR